MANLPVATSWKRVQWILSLAVVLFGVGEAANISPARTGHRRLRHGKASRGFTSAHKHQRASSCGRTITERTLLAIRLRGGGSGATITQQQQEAYGPLIEGAYDWCVNLGAPSALVAGAVVATVYENMQGGDLELAPNDTRWVRLGKQVTRLLLLSAFVLEAVSIFVTTVTGTMLLSRPAEHMALSTNVPVPRTPLEFLRANFEFEYLTSRVTFLQGLLNWLAAIGLGHLLPPPPSSKDGPILISKAKAAMNKFCACSIATVIVMMISFYNAHMTFYRNYLEMLGRWGSVSFVRFFGVMGRGGTAWPPRRPLSLLLWPLAVLSFYYAYQALSETEEEPVVAPANVNVWYKRA